MLASDCSYSLTLPYSILYFVFPGAVSESKLRPSILFSGRLGEEGGLKTFLFDTFSARAVHKIPRSLRIGRGSSGAPGPLGAHLRNWFGDGAFGAIAGALGRQGLHKIPWSFGIILKHCKNLLEAF